MSVRVKDIGGYGEIPSGWLVAIVVVVLVVSFSAVGIIASICSEGGAAADAWTCEARGTETPLLLLGPPVVVIVAWVVAQIRKNRLYFVVGAGAMVMLTCAAMIQALALSG